MSQPMHRAVLRSLLAALTIIELSDDEMVDPQVATHAFEDVVVELDTLPAGDRAVLAELILVEANQERHGMRREFLMALPESLGLLDPDEDE